MDNYAVRFLSVAIVAFFLCQLLNKKGSTFHIRTGMLAGVCGFFTLVAVLVRGYIRYDEPHGSLYPVHIALSVLFFVLLAMVIITGIAIWIIRRKGDDVSLTLVRLHGTSARASAVLLAISLVAGFASLLSHV